MTPHLFAAPDDAAEYTSADRTAGLFSDWHHLYGEMIGVLPHAVIEAEDTPRLQHASSIRVGALLDQAHASMALVEAELVKLEILDASNGEIGF